MSFLLTKHSSRVQFPNQQAQEVEAAKLARRPLLLMLISGWRHSETDTSSWNDDDDDLGEAAFVYGVAVLYE